MSINKVMLLGNVTQEPKVRTFDDGGKVVNISLATNKRGYTSRDGREIPEQTEFHNVVINRKGLAEVAEKYIHKGDKVYFGGELRTRKYEANGVTHYSTEVYVDELELLGKKQASQEPSLVDSNEPF